MPVRSGTPLDDKLLREVCRTKSGAAGSASCRRQCATPIRSTRKRMVCFRLNEALITAQEVARHSACWHVVKRATCASAARSPRLVPSVAWSYEGSGGPDSWAKLKPEQANLRQAKPVSD